MESIAIAELIAPASKVVGIQKTLQLSVNYTPSNATDKAVMWESNKPAVATVDATGKVTGVGLGTANITVKSKNDNSKTNTLEVTVKPLVTSITVSEKSSKNTISTKGGALTLTGAAEPDTAHQLFMWSSSDDAKVSITPAAAAATGATSVTVTALKNSPSAITITATAMDGSNKSKDFSITSISNQN